VRLAVGQALELDPGSQYIVLWCGARDVLEGRLIQLEGRLQRGAAFLRHIMTNKLLAVAENAV